jgi:hypothetical protein
MAPQRPSLSLSFYATILVFLQEHILVYHLRLLSQAHTTNPRIVYAYLHLKLSRLAYDVFLFFSRCGFLSSFRSDTTIRIRVRIRLSFSPPAFPVILLCDTL